MSAAKRARYEATPENLSDELWQHILANLSLLDRLKLELVSRRFYQIMPYDRLSLCIDELMECESTAHVENFLECLKSKLIRKNVYAKSLVSTLPVTMKSVRLIGSFSRAQTTKISLLARCSAEIISLLASGVFSQLQYLQCNVRMGQISQQSLHNFAAGVPELKILCCINWFPYSFPTKLKHVKIESRRDYQDTYIESHMFNITALGACPELQFVHIESTDQFDIALALSPTERVPVRSLGAKQCGEVLLKCAGGLTPLLTELSVRDVALDDGESSGEMASSLLRLQNFTLKVTQQEKPQQYVGVCTDYFGDNTLHLKVDIIDSNTEQAAQTAFRDLAKQFQSVRVLELRQATSENGNDVWKSIFAGCATIESLTIVNRQVTLNLAELTIDNIELGPLVKAMLILPNAPASLRHVNLSHIYKRPSAEKIVSISDLNKETRTEPFNIAPTELLNALLAVAHTQDMFRYPHMSIHHDWGDYDVPASTAIRLAQRGFVLFNDCH